MPYLDCAPLGLGLRNARSPPATARALRCCLIHAWIQATQPSVSDFGLLTVVNSHTNIQYTGTPTTPEICDKGQNIGMSNITAETIPKDKSKTVIPGATHHDDGSVVVHASRVRSELHRCHQHDACYCGTQGSNALRLGCTQVVVLHWSQHT